VTVQPGDRRGRLRASHADREHVIDTLKVAFVQGRLTKDEFDTRVARTLAARTYTDLSMVTVDIPPGLTDLPADPVQARPSLQPDRGPMSNAAKAGLSVAVALIVLVVLTALTGSAGFLVCMAFYLMALPVAGAQFLYSRQQSRSGGKLPPSRDTRQAGPPHPSGEVFESGPGQPRRDETRTDLRRHRPAMRLPTVPMPIGSYG
jgi:hypothetical protein